MKHDRIILVQYFLNLFKRFKQNKAIYKSILYKRKDKNRKHEILVKIIFPMVKVESNDFQKQDEQHQ